MIITISHIYDVYICYLFSWPIGSLGAPGPAASPAAPGAPLRLPGARGPRLHQGLGDPPGAAALHPGARGR